MEEQQKEGDKQTTRSPLKETEGKGVWSEKGRKDIGSYEDKEPRAQVRIVRALAQLHPNPVHKNMRCSHLMLLPEETVLVSSCL